LDDIDLTNPDNSLVGGNIVEFVQPFSTFKAGSVIRIGNVLIETDPEDVEEEEECY
jgi:hypothetical protein